MEKPKEFFDTIISLQEAARKYQRDGYIVLVANCQHDHWIGYSTFKADGSDEGKLLLFTDKANLNGADPKAIYVKN